MKKIIFLSLLLVSTFCLSAKDVHAGFKLDFNSGFPFQANGTAGFILRHKVTEYFYFDNIVDGGYSMVYTGILFDQGMILSHAFYPTFRFGKGRAFLTFSTPSPVFKVIPFLHRAIHIEADYYSYSSKYFRFFDVYFGISQKISFEIEMNDKVIFSPVSLNADIVMNIVESIFPSSRMSVPGKFMGGLGSYILIKIK